MKMHSNYSMNSIIKVEQKKIIRASIVTNEINLNTIIIYGKYKTRYINICFEFKKGKFSFD